MSGVLNNYTVGYTGNGAADELMQRLLTPEFNVAEMSPERTMTVPDPNNPGQMMTITIPSVQTSYAQTSGSVYDSQPRTISNLIADQTLGNIAAISAALQIVGITGVDNLNISKQIHAAYEAAQAQQAGTALLDRPALEAALATEQGQLADAMVARDLAATNLVTAQNTYDAAVLAEAHRVLGPGGKALFIVPNRSGLWARRDATPFGFGRPYSLGQLEVQMRRHDFTPERHAAALFAPPSHHRFWLRSAELVEKMGARLSRHYAGGVIMLEVSKRVPAPNRTGLAERMRQPLKVLEGVPMPAGASNRYDLD